MSQGMYKFSDKVINAAIEVHKILGPGLLESIYEKALCLELTQRHLNFRTQVPIDVSYKGQNLGLGYRADILVESELLIELKSVESISNIHIAQTLTYLKLLNLKTGLILNFNQKYLKNGIKRIAN